MKSRESETSLAKEFLTGTPPVPEPRKNNPVFMDKPVQPENEGCETDTVPSDTVDMKGKKVIVVPDLLTMNKVLFDRYRLSMYTFLNRSLRNGLISSLVNAIVTTKRITREKCSFEEVSFRRISRESFYAIVGVKLKLNTVTGAVKWKGFLICRCEFYDKLICTPEKLANYIGQYCKDTTPLDSFLIPYASNKDVDRIAEEIWKSYDPSALYDPSRRLAEELAELMGLHIEYHPVYEHRNVESIVFFKEDRLDIGDDRYEKDEDGKKTFKKAPQGEPVIIPADTIVINTNKLKKEYSSFSIFHECYHYAEHYLFYKLQELCSNDLRIVKTKEVEMDENNVQRDPIYFMEKQANRGAYGLMMPESDTRSRISSLHSSGIACRHQGERYEHIGKNLSKALRVPDFRVRARMIQLGNIEARGSLNYVDRKPIRPFAFNRDSWSESRQTYIVSPSDVEKMRKASPGLDELLSSGRYIYADGHVVINKPDYVTFEKSWCGEDKPILTDLAERHVDDCCLRFVRLYVQQNVGRYVFGRMYMDDDYVKQTQFFLSDLINSRQLDELDAKTEFKKEFPVSFYEAITMLRKKRKLSAAKMAEALELDEHTFSRWMKNPKHYRDEDLLTMICLILNLPDWISVLVFKRAGVSLDEDDKRQRALLHILRVQSADGIEAANAYLRSNNLAALNLVGIKE